MHHPGPGKDVPSHIVAVAQAADLFDHQSQQHKAAIAVPAALARREIGRLVDELGQEIKEAGFAVEAVLAVEGAAVFLQDLEQQWSDPERRDLILEAVCWLEGDPSVIGVTGHLVAIGTKS